MKGEDVSPWRARCKAGREAAGQEKREGSALRPARGAAPEPRQGRRPLEPLIGLVFEEGRHRPSKCHGRPSSNTSPWIDCKGPRTLLGFRGKAPGGVRGNAPSRPLPLPSHQRRAAFVAAPGAHLYGRSQAVHHHRFRFDRERASDAVGDFGLFPDRNAFGAERPAPGRKIGVG
jgi:hypothetical protein